MRQASTMRESWDEECIGGMKVEQDVMVAWEFRSMHSFHCNSNDSGCSLRAENVCLFCSYAQINQSINQSDETHGA
jgi:hypothetical protein